MSVPERAILEMMNELPQQESFHQVDAVMEGMANLRPQLLQRLLQECKSVKVKRLFLWYADRHMAGRMTQEANPETGTVSYAYDVACSTTPASPGDLTKKVDNAGNTTCFYYDALHRLSGGGYGGVCRRFNYDTSVTQPGGVSVTNTKTRLREAETDNCSGTLITDEWFSYSPRGELTDVYESTPHSGGYYHTTALFWPSGALQALSGIPSAPTLNYGAGGAGLDGEGRYTQVTASLGANPVTSVSYSTSSTTNPLGALTGVTYGSSDSDSFSYDPNTGRALAYTFAVNGSADVGSMSWNANGTMAGLSINDSIPGTGDSQSCSFSYDDLGRSSSVNCGAAWQQSFSYDAFGNIDKSGSGTFQATYSPVTNQFSLGGGGVSYDANGNLLSDNLNRYTWDPNWGGMTSVNGITATYDALGRVVEQGSGSSYTQILYSPMGKTALMNGTSLTTAFVPLPGGGTAVYNASGLAYYRHADWLGSSRLASTQSRGLYSSTAYAPFGEQYAASGTADPSFTGQNSDTVPSLYDFTFRRLSPSQGRWISPDPSGLAAVDPTSPQTWNRYAYVINNPLRFTDPKGLNLVNPGGCLTDQQICPGGDLGFANGGGGGYDANGVPWNWGPGWIMQTTTPLYQLQAGVSRYLSIINTGWDPVLGINWNNPQNGAQYLPQANGQYNRLSANLLAVFGPDVIVDPTNCDLIGGHCNFLCDSLSCPTAGRYDDGIHVENMDGGIWIHDDTVSPWTGQFTAGALFTGNFWEHGFVDLIGGTFFVGAFPQ